MTHRENRTGEHPMEFLECRLVGGTERGGKFLRLVGLAVLQSLAGKREAAEEPHQAFGSGSLLLALFVFNKLFQRPAEGGGSVVSGTDFL